LLTLTWLLILELEQEKAIDILLVNPFLPNDLPFQLGAYINKPKLSPELFQNSWKKVASVGDSMPYASTSNVRL